VVCTPPKTKQVLAAARESAPRSRLAAVDRHDAAEHLVAEFEE
jgi:hypothetical protein